MIFGIWWGLWLFIIAIVFCLWRALYLNWQATKPMSDENWDKAYNKAWNDSLDKLAGKKKD